MQPGYTFRVLPDWLPDNKFGVKWWWSASVTKRTFWENFDTTFVVETRYTPPPPITFIRNIFGELDSHYRQQKNGIFWKS